MKRYVKEFAADINKLNAGLLDEEIETILQYREMGMITDWEAVLELLSLVRDREVK